MIKTLIYSEVFPPFHGGSGRWLWEVYTRLNHEQYVVLAGKYENDELFDKKSPLKIERFDFDYDCWSYWSLTSLKSYIFYYKLIKNTLKIVKKYNIKSIHCGRCIPEGFVAYLLRKLTGVKYVCYIHGEDVHSASESRAMKWIVKKALKRADTLICNSQNSRKILLEEWDISDNRIEVINPGVDTSVFVPESTNPQILERFGWTGKRVVLTVSRLEERKGQDMMIRAVNSIKKEIPNILYAIVGSGEHLNTLKSIAIECQVEDHVLFMSNLSDEEMINCYQQCDLFILPNRDIGKNIEGFGIVMIEAQACGKPVLSGNSGGTPETLLDGVSGKVLDCTKSENIAIGVIDMLISTTKLESYANSAREHSEKYDWKNVAKHIEKATDA